MSTFSARESLYRCVSLCAIAAIVTIGVACGGKDDGSGNDGGSGSRPPVQAPNGARLGWTQSAASQQELNAMTFRLFVDGNQQALSNVTCAPPSGGDSECSGRLPNMSSGQHVIRLATLLNGTLSSQSDPLTIIITGSTQTAPQANETGSGAPSRSAAATFTCTVEPRQCYDVDIIRRELGQVQSPTLTADGRLLFIENGASIRVIAGNRLLVEPALTAPDANGRIVGLAADPSSDDRVFVAWTELVADGERLNITRYRELQNVLGEGATIVSGLALPSGAAAPLAVDRSGLLYVAMPAAQAGGVNEDFTSDAGLVLRFTRDGLIPATNPRLSPVIAQGYSKPSGLVIDDSDRVWVAGDQPQWPYSVATFPITVDPSTSWPQHLRPRLQTARLATPESTWTWLSLARSDAPGISQWLVIASGGQVSRGAIASDDRALDLTPVRFDPPISVDALVQGPLGSWYVMTRDDGVSTSILRLTPR
jgi:hypothetical protein